MILMHYTKSSLIGTSCSIITFDEKRVRDWIERNMNRYHDNGFGLWAVCLKDTREMIGDCGLTLKC